MKCNVHRSDYRHGDNLEIKVANEVLKTFLQNESVFKILGYQIWVWATRNFKLVARMELFLPLSYDQ